MQAEAELKAIDIECAIAEGIEKWKKILFDAGEWTAKSPGELTGSPFGGIDPRPRVIYVVPLESVSPSE
jgi:hypothetical protein